jgi:peptidoglycan/xylan/chitin deacetylase (PgdA/CDA1 family)
LNNTPDSFQEMHDTWTCFSRKIVDQFMFLFRGHLEKIGVSFLVVFILTGCISQTPDLPSPTEEKVAKLVTETVEPSPVPTRTKPAAPEIPTETQEATSEPPTPQAPIATAKRIPIIEYHDSQYQMASNRIIMTTEWFLEQMAWLDQNEFKTLSAQELIEFVEGTYQPPERSVVLSFDVGTPEAEDFHEVIIPTLRKYHFTALFFVLTSAITTDGADNSLTWAELREWQEEGLITVESHGVYHPDYQLLNTNQMLWDAKTSFEILSEEIGTPPLIFAYPFDSVPEEPEGVMQDAGYRIALAGHRDERSVVPMDPNPFSLPRYYPYSNEEIYPILTDGYGWTFPELMMAAITEDGHATAADPSEPTPESPYPSPNIPSTLDQLVQYCRYAGEDAIYELDQYAKFPTDVSPMAQERLSHPILIRPTCHFGQPIIPEAVVLHFTEGAYSSAVNEFRESELEASIHYIIDRDGTITQMVPEYFGAHHVLCYGDRAMCTRTCPICEDEDGALTEPWTRSIGIELVNNGRLRGYLGDFKNPDDTPFEGLVFEDYLVSWSYRYWEDYPLEQVDAMRILVEDIMARWDIPLEMVLGHSRIQLNKNDPGPALNLTWARYGDPPRDPIFVPTPMP